MIVSVIGLGYIGLPTAAVLASNEIKVIGVDVNQQTIDTINSGRIHIIEPGLDVLVSEALKKGYLKAVIKPQKADVFMIAVPTPLGNGNKPDLSFVKSAAKAIAPVLEKGNLVILESTSPVGTTEKLTMWMRDERSDISFPEFGNNNFLADIAVAHCPERVLPGKVLRELIENNRIIGGISDNCARQAKDLYKIFVHADCLLTDSRTAELCKLVENSFRDVNIAFANELSLISDKLGVNVWNLIKLANQHPRVNILQPGPGVGGHCIAVDPWFISDSAPNESKLIQTARLVNDNKPNFVIDKINKSVKAIGRNRSDIKIVCLGLSFKPDIDDLRESPALEIALKIRLMGFSELMLVEPNISNIPSELKHESVCLSSFEKAIKASDIVVLLVDHTPFKSIDLNELSGKQIIDTRGTWS